MFYMYSRLRFCLWCGMAWTDCVQFCLATGQVFSGEILACTEQEMWITLNGAVKQVICWAEFMWRDWEWSCFLTSHPNSWFHLVRLDRRDQSWPRIVVALGDGLNEEMPVTVFFLHVFYKAGWWCWPPFPLPALSAVPGSSFPRSHQGIRLLAVLAFSLPVLACFCPYPAFVLGMLMT